MSAFWETKVKPLLVRAWDLPVPSMPDDFGRYEHDETFDAAQCFRGKHWDEVEGHKIPLWFSPLSYLPESIAGYYLASIVKNLCVAQDDTAYRFAEFIELFLHRESSEPRPRRITLLQREALLAVLPTIRACPEYREFFSEDFERIIKEFKTGTTWQ